eukprot:gene8427-10216_t
MESKRSKTDGSLDIINQALLQPESRKALRKTYITATPYPHLVFDPICDKSHFTKVRDEIVENLETKYKETDLFKLYQTTDLANIDETQPELSKKLPTLLELRDQLYSQEFRDFISDVTGCGELTDRVDMAASAYAHGSHLLCHDDVIGTRAVSFILYFSREGWSCEDGGALELYPLDEGSIVNRTAEGTEREEMLVQGVPTAHPTRRLLPLFNTMAIFRVMPGRSYHSVQEVMVDGSPRLSIQGWFHGVAEPVGNELASLNQLKTAALQEKPFTSISNLLSEPVASLQCFTSDKNGQNSTAATVSSDSKDDRCLASIEATALSEDDIIFLSSFINETYLKADALSAIGKEFEASSSVQLQTFLRSDLAAHIMKEIIEIDEQDGLASEKLPKDNAGIRSGWVVVGPAHMQRYLKFDLAKWRSTPDNSDTHEKIRDTTNPSMKSRPENASPPIATTLEQQLFRSPSFCRFLSMITGGRLTGFKTRTRRFRSGLDYTVAHHGQLNNQESVLDATLCFVNDKSPIDAAQWASGDVGGFECYLAAENEDNVAAEVYCDDDAQENDLLSVSPSSNTLSLVFRDPGTMRFIKYVSAAAVGSRWDTSCEYQLEYDESDGDGDGNDFVINDTKDDGNE